MQSPTAEGIAMYISSINMLHASVLGKENEVLIMGEKTTLTVQLSERFSNLLTELAKKEGTSKVDVVKRAIALYSFVDDEVLGRGDRKLAIVDSNDRVIRDIILAS